MFSTPLLTISRIWILKIEKFLQYSFLLYFITCYFELIKFKIFIPEYLYLCVIAKTKSLIAETNTFSKMSLTDFASQTNTVSFGEWESIFHNSVCFRWLIFEYNQRATYNFWGSIDMRTEETNLLLAKWITKIISQIWMFISVSERKKIYDI